MSRGSGLKPRERSLVIDALTVLQSQLMESARLRPADETRHALQNKANMAHLLMLRLEAEACVQSPDTFAVGEAIEVYSFGRWYPGTVTKIGRTRVTALYVTGTGTEREKAFPTNKVRASTGGDQ